MFRNLSPRALGFASSIQTEMIELALTYGFTGIDISIEDFAQQVEDFGLEDARRLIDSAKRNGGMRVGSFPLPVRVSEDDSVFKRDLQRLPALAALAAEMDCDRSVLTLQPGHQELPERTNFEQHLERLTQVAEVLAQAHVRLGIEFIGVPELYKDKQFEFIHDLTGTLELIDGIAQPNVGLAINSWHLYCSGGSIDQILQLPADRIISVQIADAPEGVPVDQLADLDRRLPGETRVIDNVSLLSGLGQLGYQGPITPSPLRQRVKGMGRQRAVKETGEFLQQVWSEAGLPPNLPSVPVPSEDDGTYVMPGMDYEEE